MKTILRTRVIGVVGTFTLLANAGFTPSICRPRYPIRKSLCQILARFVRGIARHILAGAILLVPSISSQAATLVNGDVLSFPSGTGSTFNATVLNVFTQQTYSLVDSLDGIVIGTAQPTGPGIDATWHDATFGLAGYDYTSSPVTVLSPTTLDFSGWVIHWNQLDLNVGATQGIANYTFDGTNFTLDYYWNYGQDAGGVPLNGLEDYHLHLIGTVSSVPVPAAFWLFGSGLLGLIGVARRKAA